MSASDTGIEVWTDPTKSEFVFDADITKAVYQDGTWYIIPNRYCWKYQGATSFISRVFHVCSKTWSPKTFLDIDGVEKKHALPYTCSRLRPKHMQLPCKNCGETPPEGLVGLWTLHNWDYLSL